MYIHIRFKGQSLMENAVNLPNFAEGMSRALGYLNSLKTWSFCGGQFLSQTEVVSLPGGPGFWIEFFVAINTWNQFFHLDIDESNHPKPWEHGPRPGFTI